MLQTNTFQCVIATDGCESYVIYLYADGLIQWTTGDSSDGVNGTNGTTARIGYSSIDGVNVFNVSESGTTAIINIAQTSNINTPGVWMFRISGEGT